MIAVKPRPEPASFNAQVRVPGNYRFACLRMNSRKRDASDVLDPFFLVDGWFTIYFPTMRVKPSGGLSATDLQKVKDTIKRLKLNSRECREERIEYWDDYKANNISAFQLQKHAPFIAMEAARQGLLKPADAAMTVASIRAWLDS